MSGRMVPMRAKKRDGNEAYIVKCLLAVGASVAKLDIIDLAVGYDGRTFFIEIKQPGAQLSEKQFEWHAKWRGQVDIAWDWHDVMIIIGAADNWYCVDCGGPLLGVIDGEGDWEKQCAYCQLGFTKIGE